MKYSMSVSVQYDSPFSPFRGRDWQEALTWVKASGFDAAELIVCDPELLDLRAIRKKLQQLALPVSTVSTGQAAGMEGLSMVSADAGVRRAALKRLSRDIDFAAELGKPHVTVGLIRGRGGVVDPEIERGLLRDSLLRAADYAAQKGIILNLEPVNRYECRHLNQSMSVLSFLHEIGDPPHVGVLYDTFHSNIEDADMGAAVRALGSRITNVHIADSNRLLPGEGHIDFPAVSSALEDIDYDGYAALEVLNRPSPQHIIDNAGTSIHKIFDWKFTEKGSTSNDKF